MKPAEAERIRKAAITNGRRERRQQNIPDHIEASDVTATLASLLSASPTTSKE